MFQKRKIISLTNLKHQNNKVVLKTSNSIVSSLRKEAKLENLLFTIKRLLRGLGGPKLRAGCFATLKWLINTIPGHIEYAVYQKIIHKVLSPGARDSLNEKGDVAMGEMLAYAIIINTNYLKKYDSDLWMMIASRIMDVACKKSYLCYPAYKNLCVLYSRYDIKGIPDNVMEHLKIINVHTLDKLHFIIKLSPELQAVVIKSVFNSKRRLTDKKILTLIVDLIMKETTSSCDHPFFEVFIKIITSDLKSIKVFWGVILKAIENKQIQEIKMFLPLASLLVENVDDFGYIVSSMIQNDLIKLIKAKGKSEDVKHFLNVLHKRLLDQPNQRVPLITKLLFELNFINLEECSGTNFISKHVIKLNLSEIKSLADQFRLFLSDNLCKSKGKDLVIATPREKFIIFKYYASLINNAETKNEREWRCDQLKSVIDAGVFSGIVNNIKRELCESMRNCLYNAIGTIGSIFQYRETLVQLLEHILLRLEQEHNLSVKITTDEVKKLMKNIKWIISKIKANSDSTNITPTTCAEVLGLFILIHCCRNPKKFLTLFKDVRMIFLKTDDPDWTEILINIMITLLSETHAYNRAFVNSLFKISLKYFNYEALTTLSNLFFPRGVNNSDENDSDDEFSDDESSDDESNDDAMMISQKKLAVLEPATNVEESFVYSIDEPSTSIEKPKLSSEGTPGEKETKSDDDDMVDVDEMSETEKQRLNLVLQQASYSKKQAQTRKEKESALSHLRIRFLDLIELCGRQISYVPFNFWLSLIPNLYKLLKRIDSNESERCLHSKLRGTLKRISAIPYHKQYTSPTEDDSSKALIVINILLDYVTKGLQKDDKVVVLHLCRALLVHSNIYYKDEDRHLEASRFNLLLQFYMKQFYQRRKIIPVWFFVSLCEMNWEGMRKLINIAGKLTFCSDIKINRRLLGFQIITAYFNNDYYFGDSCAPDDLEVFLEAFTQMKSDVHLYKKPDCLLKFIPQLNNFLALLKSKNRNDLFNLPLMSNAVLFLEITAVEYRQSKNLSSYPEFDSATMRANRKRKFENVKLLRI